VKKKLKNVLIQKLLVHRVMPIRNIILHVYLIMNKYIFFSIKRFNRMEVVKLRNRPNIFNRTHGFEILTNK
jgi:hypothetical protein